MDYKFAGDIKEGLLSKPKKLNSKYFYDKKGSELFQDIMKMPEYYLTDAEFEILDTQKDDILKYFASDGKFDMIELGSGDGLKTKILLRHFLKQEKEFQYFPIDISKDAIINLERDLNEEMPELHLNPVIDDYFFAMDELNKNSKARKVVLFLGSNIGNSELTDSVEFLNSISKRLDKGDVLFIGFDLKKDPELILNAYKDPHGITERFNLNLLDRINEELKADFDKQKFKHHVSYNPVNGRTESFLVSKQEHNVYIEKLDIIVHFEYAEAIWMEISQKYDIQMIDNLASKSEFKRIKNFYDCKSYFCDSLWEKL